MKRAPQAGFTLLELIVVIGIISLLAGIGIGYLGNVDPEMVARAVLGGEQRAAQMTARAEGVPTEVVLRPGANGEPATVQARLLEPVCAFHFESDTVVLDERMRPTVRGEEVVAGRFGKARRPAPDDRASLLEWRLDPLFADLYEGFVLRVDLYLERRERCTLAEIEDVLELRLDADLRPEARLKLRDRTGATSTRRAESELSLPLRRWVTLEFGCDTERAWIAVDGREFARIDAAGNPQQGARGVTGTTAGRADGNLLSLSAPQEPVPGIVDELRLLAFGFAPAQTLPIELQPKRVYRWAYDSHGDLLTDPVVEYEDLGEATSGRTAAGAPAPAGENETGGGR